MMDMDTELRVRDQDGCAARCTPPPKPSSNSARIGSVWGSKQDMRVSGSMEDDGTAALLRADPPVQRAELAEWVESLLPGSQLPGAGSTDQEFREALGQDTALLCAIVNAVKGEVCAEAASGQAGDREANVQSFTRAAEQLGVPQDHLFTVADLDHPEERQCVSNCLLWLKLMQEGSISASKRSSPPAKSHAPLPYARTQRGTMAPPSQQQEQQYAQALPSQRGGGGASGVTKLMQECTVLLKAKMSYGSSAPAVTPRNSDAFSFDAVGPVLESVLGGLTQEYERRLHAKDTEIIATTEKMNLVSRQMEAMQGQLRQLKEELAQQQEAAAASASQVSAAQSEEMQARLAAMAASLEERERLYRDIEARLGGEHTQQDAHVLEMEAQLEQMRAQIDDVTSMQLKYREVQEENRKFYNMIQDLKGAIRVFCRIRPLGRTGDSSDSCINVAGENELAAYSARGIQMYKFDKVFRELTTQDEIYADTQPLVRSVLDGFNVCIFAYGQTGSGKTHTMSGTDITDYSGRGINYRALDDLFHLRDQRASEVTYDIKAQMLEIYNESLRDLLVRNGSNKLEILSTQASGCNVPNATKAVVQTADDVLQMMAEGSHNRHSAETKMNERSSRSHQVLTVIVDGYNRLTGARTHGCLHLVDLAGSERNDKSEARGDRLVEANHINSSLSALGDVMAALANKQKHVPFRNSKLTQLLADSLSGQAKVMMFMHIAPEATSFLETTSTLKFATRVNEITLGQAKKNVESGEVHKVHEELNRVRQQLAREKEEKEAAMSMLQSLQYDMRHQGSVTPYQSAASHGSEQKPPRTPNLGASPLPRVPAFATPLGQISKSSPAARRASTDGTPMSARGYPTPSTAPRNPAALPRSGSLTSRGAYGSSGGSGAMTARTLAAAADEQPPPASTTPVRTARASYSGGGGGGAPPSRLPVSHIPRPSSAWAAIDSSPGGSVSARPSGRYSTGGNPTTTPPSAPSSSLMPPPSARGLPSYLAPTTSSRAGTTAPASSRTSGTFGGPPLSSRGSGTFGGAPAASARTSGTYGGGGLARSASARQSVEPASAGGRRASAGSWSVSRR